MELGCSLLIVVEKSTDDHEVGGEHGHGAENAESQADYSLELHVKRHRILIDALILQYVTAEAEHRHARVGEAGKSDQKCQLAQ